MDHQKTGEENQKQFSKPYVWDCGSTLYDSYELTSFKRQLDSAIMNSPRTLSMPHHRSLSTFQQPQPPPPPPSNKSFKISRTFQKLLRFVFKSSNSNKFRICSSSDSFQQVVAADHDHKYSNSRDRLYVVYDKSEAAVLSTIPELPEFEIGGISPNLSSLVRKSASERFTATSIGISCA